MLERIATALHLQNLGPLALLDILVLAVLIYQLLLLLRGTRAAHLLLGVVALVLAHFLTGPAVFPLAAVHAVLGTILLYIPFAIIVLFQNPIRQALIRVGRNPLTALLPRPRHEVLSEEIALAAASLASKRIGGLVVIERELGLRAFFETGITLDAVVSYDLLMNLFTRGSPLHDGAVIIADGRIKAASCYLPLTTNPALSRTYGTRHRAAIGITEESDAIAVVVSEQRGVISLTEAGQIVEELDARMLAARLRAALAPKDGGGRGKKPRRSLVLAR
jgi:uncharacterized protein (TIGR00159 family)